MKRALSIATIVAVVAGVMILGGASTEAQAAGARILSPGVRAQTSGSAIRSLSGCLTNTLAANDDSFVGPVSLGFLINLYGSTTDSVFINNNGNVTFNAGFSTFTPDTITPGVGFGPIIAPFFADVDTRGSGSGIVAINQVKYGTDTLDGHPVFCVNWTRVGYFSSATDKQNSFQAIIISRSDIGEGDFDVEFNYDQIQWDVGGASGGVNGLCPSGTGGSSCFPARVGTSSETGQGGTSFEFVGSGQAGAFLDTNLSTGLIHNSRNSTQSGRYLLQARGGIVTADNNDDSGTPVVIDDVFFNGTTDTSNATTDPTDPDPPCSMGSRNNTIWYQLFAQFNGQVNVNTFGSNYDTVLSVWTGSPGNFQNVACNDDAGSPFTSLHAPAQVTPTPGSSQATFTATGGTTYLIMVSGKSGGGSLSVTLANQEAGNPIPAANLQTILAHSALGGGFLTRLFLTNLSSSNNSVTIHRIDQQGGTIDTIEAELLPAATLQLAANEDTRDDPLDVSWFAVGSLQSVAGSVLFEFDSAALGLSDNFRTAVGTLAAEPLTAFTTPVRVATAEVTVGLALANLVNSNNTVNLSLIDNLGTVVATDSITLAPFQQTAFNVHQRAAFSNIVLGVPEFIGSLVVTTTDANKPVAAVVVGNNLRQLYTLPVTPGAAVGAPALVAPSSLRAASSLPMPSALPTANFVTLIPHSATGGGFLSRLFVTNLSNSTNNVTIQRMNQSGTVVATVNRTLQPRGSIMEAESETVRSQSLTVQWFAIGSDQPIAAAVLFEFDGSATAATNDDFLTSVGSLSAESLTAFTTPVRVATAEVTAGVAIANPNNASNTLTMKLIDSSGNVVATDTLTLGAFAQTAFALQDRPAFSSIVLGTPEFIGSLAVNVNDASLPVAAIVVGNNNRQLFTLPVNEGVAQ